LGLARRRITAAVGVAMQVPGATGADAACRVVVEDSPRRVRVFFGDVAVADSRRVKLLFESDHLPVYYFPLEDLRQDLLVPSAHTTHCPHKGEARYWSIRAGDRLVRDAIWNYPAPINSCPDIRGLAAFYWDRADAWFEEDEEVFVHPRDPYHRVDVLESSRHVRVLVGGEVVADTHRPRLLFETNLPTRYYIPMLDVRREALQPSLTKTRCPYKGVASYWSVGGGGETHRDIAWAYQAPIAESAKIAGLVCFYNEKVELIVDGEPQPRPTTKWS